MHRKVTVLVFVLISAHDLSAAQHSVARQWNEALLEAIRNDYARPTVHARNLFHISAAMYDSWAVYDDVAKPYFLGKTVDDFTIPFDGIALPVDKQAAREETITYAVYRLLRYRFRLSPGEETSFAYFDSLMVKSGFTPSFTSSNYANGSPAALGNYIAQQIIEFGLQDGSREQAGYRNLHYQPVNDPLDPTLHGNPGQVDPNRWQPVTLGTFIDQSGNVLPVQTPEFIGAEWGGVTSFALPEEEKTSYVRDGFEYTTYYDPGPPPTLDSSRTDGWSEEFKWSFSLVPLWQGHFDQSDNVVWDISPAAMGNVPDLPQNYEEHRDFYDLHEGGDTGKGHAVNPHTGKPYESQLVQRADYTRVLAEFWADGPDTETPPGHWYTILNHVTGHTEFEKKFRGDGRTLDDLEWDVKSYFTLGGAVHDAAIAAWGIKGRYDYTRPVSAIRWMADRGQSSDPGKAGFNPEGIPLYEGSIELVREGDPLAGAENEHVGKIKLNTWRGHEYIEDPETETAGVGWILAENWWPYQRPTFVTPPFAGFVSGHSTFSRSAAEVMTLLTGDPFFPGGLGEFHAPANEFLVFEDGPEETVILQWATYRDASDQCSLSRIWGGIHPPIDDIHGRLIGEKVGINAFEQAEKYFAGTVPKPDESPVSWKLEQNYPNPFNLHTTISFYIREQSKILLKVYDITGREVATVVSQTVAGGNHTRHWNASGLASGVYIYRLEAQPVSGQAKRYVETRKATLIK